MTAQWAELIGKGSEKEREPREPSDNHLNVRSRPETQIRSGPRERERERAQHHAGAGVGFFNSANKVVASPSLCNPCRHKEEEEAWKQRKKARTESEGA